MQTEPFKVCGMCGHVWSTWRDLVRDRGLRLLGLQVVPGDPEANILVFDHACGTTVSVLTEKLWHLLPDPEAGAGLPLLLGTEACNRHCHQLEDLAACDNPCANARDRRLAILVRDLLR